MINDSKTTYRRFASSMLKVLLLACITFFSFDSFAQSINGIRIDTDGYPVTVYINGTRVSAPAASCFIANLRPDNYRIEVYQANGYSSKKGRLLFRESVYYN